MKKGVRKCDSTKNEKKDNLWSSDGSSLDIPWAKVPEASKKEPNAKLKKGLGSKLSKPNFQLKPSLVKQKLSSLDSLTETFSCCFFAKMHVRHSAELAHDLVQHSQWLIGKTFNQAATSQTKKKTQVTQMQQKQNHSTRLYYTISTITIMPSHTIAYPRSKMSHFSNVFQCLWTLNLGSPTLLSLHLRPDSQSMQTNWESTGETGQSWWLKGHPELWTANREKAI